MFQKFNRKTFRIPPDFRHVLVKPFAMALNELKKDARLGTFLEEALAENRTHFDANFFMGIHKNSMQE